MDAAAIEGGGEIDPSLQGEGYNQSSLREVPSTHPEGGVLFSILNLQVYFQRKIADGVRNKVFTS